MPGDFYNVVMRWFTLFALVSVGVIFLVFIHLEGEISRLDAAKLKLEETVSSLDHGGRRLPAQYIQDSLLQSFDDGTLPVAGGGISGVGGSPSDEMIVIYNRVPKTGSTSLAGIAYDLCKRNKYHVLHFNITKNNHVMSIADQMRFVNNITTWRQKKPAFYHGHLAYIEFNRFGAVPRPLYINVIRKPLDRLVSYYYFVRHGDDFRPHLKRRKSGNKETFDQCVAMDKSECDPVNLWIQIPFFCGHAAECWEPGSQWAFEMAKYNLVQNYLLVGLTEELGDFVAVLETVLPRFFSGATELYNSGHKSHLRKTFNKQQPSEATIARIQQSPIWRMEQEFYDFASEQFHFMRRKTFASHEGVMQERPQQFTYEKVRPR